MKRRCILLLLTLLTAAMAQSHHSFAMFDTTRTLELTGTVRGFEWTNPHIWIQVMVDTPQGTQQQWSIEGPSPNRLAREGWKSSTLKAGDKITVFSNPLRNGEPGGSLVRVRFPDGRILGMKSTTPEYSGDKAK
jgi:hypothetical protein